MSWVLIADQLASSAGSLRSSRNVDSTHKFISAAYNLSSPS